MPLNKMRRKLNRTESLLAWRHPKQRLPYSAQVYGNKLIIFGGMNSYNYIGSSLFIVELDILNSNMLNNVMHLKDYHIPQINDSQYFSNKLPEALASVILIE